MRAPKPGDEVTVYGRPARITAANVEASTFCVAFTDTLGPLCVERAHDLPWPVLVRQNWACDFSGAPLV